MPRPLRVPVLLSLSLCLGPACSGETPDGVAIGERALVVDDDGATHVAWVDRESGTILYGTNASGGWVTETVDTFTPPEAPTGDVSIALDPGGTPRVEYRDAADGTPRAATRQPAGLWLSVPRVDPVSSGL